MASHGVPDGAALHKRVPPQRWGVSPADLRSFRRRVRRCMGDGTLKQTDLDAFAAGDNAVGPRVHTVVLQIIKPVTAKAGNVSWALMLHPAGLQCDVFVTHGWHEGILEFIDKVINSWPWGAQGAYCCMFANPHNLDIGALLANPRDSPFARALSDARFMMVVPNAQVSIYSRIWCAYEAFLAYEQSKLIFTAVTPTPRHAWLKALRYFAFHLLVCGISTCAFFLTLRGSEEEPDWDSALSYDIMGWPPGTRVLIGFAILAAGCTLTIALVSPPGSACQRMMMLLSPLLVSIPSGYWLRSFLFTVTDGAHFDTRHRAAYFRVELLTNAATVQVLYGVCMGLREVDSAWSGIHGLEHRAPWQGYTGHLRDAQSSIPADKDNICAELSSSGCEEAADRAVRVLIENGMSTPRLRRVVELVGDLRKAGRWYMAMSMGTPIMIMMCVRDVVARSTSYTTYALYRLPETGRCECLVRGHRCVEAGICEQDSGTCSPSGFHSACQNPVANPFFLMTIVNLLMGAAWLFVVGRRMHPDLQRFAAIVCTKFIPVACIVGIAIDCLRSDNTWVESNSSSALRFLTFLLVFAIVALGPVRLARLPAIGPLLVRFFFYHPTFGCKPRADPPENGGGAAPASGGEGGEREEEILPI